MAIDKTGTPMPTTAEYENSVIVRSERDPTLGERAGKTIGGGFMEGIVNGLIGLGIGATLGGVGGYLLGNSLQDAVGNLTPEQTNELTSKYTELQTQLKTLTASNEMNAVGGGALAFSSEQTQIPDAVREFAKNAKPEDIQKVINTSAKDLLAEIANSAPKVGAVAGAIAGGTVVGGASALTGATKGAIQGAFTRKIIEERALKAQQMQQGQQI